MTDMNNTGYINSLKFKRTMLNGICRNVYPIIIVMLITKEIAALTVNGSRIQRFPTKLKRQVRQKQTQIEIYMKFKAFLNYREWCESFRKEVLTSTRQDGKDMPSLPQQRPCFLELQIALDMAQDFPQTLVQVLDLNQLQNFVDRMRHVGDLLNISISKYGDLHIQISTTLITLGAEFQKLLVIGQVH